MRKIYYLFLLFAVETTFAQTNIFPVSGNVGIGTTTPAVKLDVRGAVNFNTQFFNENKLNYYGTEGTATSGQNRMAVALYSIGKKLFPDENFTYGLNSIKVYDNNQTNTVTINRITAPAGAPNKSGYVLEIKHAGAGQTPGLGGFYFANSTRSNATFACVFKAKLPVGYSFSFNSNWWGTGGKLYWATDNVGTGKWEDYVYVVRCGDSGTFSSTNFFFINGSPAPSAESPLIWHLASATVYDCDDRMENISATDALVSNKLGIGTASPTYKLQIELPDTLAYSSTNITNGSTMYLHNSDATNKANKFTGIRFGVLSGSSTSLGFINLVQPASANSASDFVFKLRTSSGTIGEVMRMKSNGFVGFGTINPMTNLDVVGANGTPSGSPTFPVRITSGSGTNTGFISERSDAGKFINFWTGGVGAVIGFSSDASRLAIGSYTYANRYSTGFPSTEVMSLLPAGNVGIGITSPSEKLHVTGNILTSAKVGFNNDIANHYIGSVSNGMEYRPRSIGKFNFTSGDGSWLFENGNVSIGAATIPAGYKLAVAGNIIAEKIKVKKQSSGWPDYVFSSTYRLQGLDEVERFIKTNSHLPEIPSAKEIEKEGHDLGDMDRLLLKKIEELTLYVIEQNKKIQELEKTKEELSILQTEIQRLKKTKGK